MTEHEKRSLQYRLARRFDSDPRRIMEIIREEIKKTPLTEELPEGEWIEEEVFDGDIAYECSECGELFCLIAGTPADNLYNFCPNCGADMREG